MHWTGQLKLSFAQETAQKYHICHQVSHKDMQFQSQASFEHGPSCHFFSVL